MKNYLLILSSLIVGLSSLKAQQSVLSSFNGYGDIINVIDIDPTDSLFTIEINNFYGSPRFQPYGPWIAQDVQVGMVMWVDCARFVITNVNSASFSTMSIDVKVPSVDWNLGVATPLPNSRCAVVFEDQYLLTALPAPADGNSGALSGINNTLFACMLNHYSQALLVTKNSVNEITDYVAGLDTIPSEAPGPNIGETWRNSVGQLFYSDGTQWLTDKEIKFSNAPLQGLPSYLYKLGIDTLGQDTLYIANNGIFNRFQSGLVYKEGYGINIYATDSIEVDTNQIATQYDISLLPTGIDTFQLNNDTLKLSLINDFEPFKKVILPVVGINSGVGISTASSGGVHTITNTAPDQVVSITGAGISNVTGTYPNFTVTSTEVDGSITNEGLLSVGAGTGTTSIIQSNTSGSNPITLTGAGITTVNETGNTITITSTEVDGSTTNELQTLSTVSNTVTLSNSGGSFTIAGAGINTVGTAGTTITVTGTEVDGSISNEGILGIGAGNTTSATILSNTSTSNPITLNAAGIISITETTSSNGGSITLTGTEVDGSITNEIQDLSLSGQTLSLTSDPTTVTLPVIGITAGTGISTSSTSGNFTITNTGDLSNTNELQQIDTFRVNGSNLELSLQNDNQAVRTVSLSSIVTGGGGLTGNGVLNYLSQYNSSSTLDTTGVIWVGGRLGIGVTTPQRTLHVQGEARISDLTTDTPTRIVGADADGDLGELTLGSGLSLSGGTLNTSSTLNTGSGTAGQVTYWTGTNSISGNNALTYNTSTNTLGINTATTTPSGANLIIKNSQEPVRTTVVTTQGFAADTTNWTRGAGWTFTGGQAVATLANGALTYTPALTITSGNWYEVTYTMTGYSTGTLTANVGNSSVALPSVNVTSNVVVLKPTSATGGFRFTTSAFTGNIDNVTVVEISNPAPILFAGQDDNTTTLYNSLVSPSSGSFGFGGGLRYSTAANNYSLGNSALRDLTSGLSNIGIGNNAGAAITSGSNNIGIGNSALFRNLSGSSNVGVGTSALENNTTGSSNTAVGLGALSANTSGGSNSGFGNNALAANTIGINNTAIGAGALTSSRTGNNNVGIGSRALQFNVTGSDNMSMGFESLQNNTATGNVGLGSRVLREKRAGNFNTAIGTEAGFNSVVADSLTGANNTLIGYQSATNIAGTASNNLVLGNQVNLPINNGNNQINIKNIIFGTGASGTGTTIAGNIGIGNNSPQARLQVSGSSAVGTDRAVLVTDNAATPLNLFEIRNNGDIYLNDYPNTVNTAGNPVNVLSTGTDGLVQSHPISEVISGAGGVTGSGSADRITFWTGANTVSSNGNLLWWGNAVGNFSGLGVGSIQFNGFGSNVSNTGQGFASPGANRTLFVKTGTNNNANDDTGIQLDAGVLASRTASNSFSGVSIISDLQSNVGGILTTYRLLRLEPLVRHSMTTVTGIDYNPNFGVQPTNHYAAIFRSGFVGIGLTTPTANLHVRSTGTTSSTTALLIQNGAATPANLLTVLDNGNIGIGTNAPEARLQINGSGNTNTTTALTVRNSNGQNAIRVLDNGEFRIGNANSYIWIWPYSTAYDEPDINGTNISFYPIQGEISFGGGSRTNTTGAARNVVFAGRFAPASGTSTYTDLLIPTRIAQTGGANGITRGLHINPNLVSASDWRSIEWSNTSGYGLYGAGTALNYLGGNLSIGVVTPTRTLDVNGETRIRDLTTTTATSLVGADADGVLSSVSFSSAVTSGGGLTGNGVTNYLSQYNSTSTLDTTGIIWTGGRMGIGTATPSSTVDIVGSVEFQNPSVAFDGPTLGSELLTTGSGTGWTGSNYTTGYTHSDTNFTNVLTSVFTPANATIYRLVVTCSGRTVGTATVTFGGKTITTFTSNTAVTWDDITTSTAALVVTPSKTFNGTITASVKLLNVSSAQFVGRNNAGTIVYEERLSSLNTNIFQGISAGQYNTSGTNNLFQGRNAGRVNTTGNSNIFQGNDAGRSNTTGFTNIFQGDRAGYSNTTGYFNIFQGPSAGYSNTTGFNNIFQGANAGYSNTTGTTNIFQGFDAGANNTTGSNNIFQSYRAGFRNTTGVGNVFQGLEAGASNTTGSYNIFQSGYSGYSNTTGNNNIFQGLFSGYFNISGSNNVAIGASAGRYVSYGTNVSNTRLSNSILIGVDARSQDSLQSNQIVIGYEGRGLGSNKTRIGNSSTIQTHLDGNLTVGNTLYDPNVEVRIVGPTSGTTTYGLSVYNSTTGTSTSSVPSFTVRDDGNVGMGALQGTYKTTIRGDGFGLFVRAANVSPFNQIIASFVYGGNGNTINIEPINGRASIQARATTLDGAAAMLLQLNPRGGIVSVNNDNPDASAIFDVKSTTQGLLPPRMTTTQRDAIVSPATGLQIYNTTANVMQHYNGTSWVNEGGSGYIGGTLATGQVAFGSATNTISGSNNLFWDSANGRLGIGTNAPSYSLQVAGEIGAGVNTTFTTNTSYYPIRNSGSFVDYTNNSGATHNNGAGIFFGHARYFGDFGFQTTRGLSMTTESRNPGIGSSNALTSGYFLSKTSTVGTASNLIAVDAQIETLGSGTVTNVSGVISGLLTSGSGNVTNSYGFRVLNISNTSTGAITNTYGLYIGDITAGTQTNTPYSIYAEDANARNYLAGNTGIGETIPTARLQVKGSGNTDATLSLTVQNNDASNLLRVNNAGAILFGNSSNSVQAYPSANTNVLNLSGDALTFLAPTPVNNFTFGSFNFSGNTGTNTSGFYNLVSMARPFSPTSGTAQWTMLAMNPTINQTGTATGITRGLYISPNLTSAADWRSIQWDNNVGFGLYGVGTANNYLAGSLGIGVTAPTDQLHTTGTVRLQNYPNTLNSAGNPVNVLSTSSTGVIESHPISEVISSAGGVTGSGASGQVTFWNGTSTQSGDNAFSWDNVNKRFFIGNQYGNGGINQTGASNIFYQNSFSTVGGETNYWFARRSRSNTIGTLAPTANNDFLGVMYFQGVNTSNSFQYGAAITAQQKGTVGAFIPTYLILNTYSATASNSNQLVLNSNSNVGISTNEPSARLHVVGAGTTSGYGLIVTDVNNTTATASLVVQDNGRVGIGTNAPTSKFDVIGAVEFQNPTATFDGGALGTELLSSSNWTSLGWTGNFTSGFTHTTGNTTALTNTLTATIGTYYQIAYTVTGRTAGSFTVSFGGASNDGITSTGAFGPIATSTASLSITPTTDFNGTIIISIKVITNSSANISFLNSAGAVTNQIYIHSSFTNTSIGINALSKVTTGVSNTSFGQSALSNTTTGSSNVAIGRIALFSNSTGNSNVAVGASALTSNTTGGNNMAVGSFSLTSNTSGGSNTAIGTSALNANTIGDNNMSIGSFSLNLNISGSSNIAIGVSSLSFNTTGNDNTAIGRIALLNNTTGAGNTAIGRSAGANSTTNLTGNDNTLIGVRVATNIQGTASGNLILGNDVNLPVATGSNQVVIKNIIFATGASGTGTTIAGNVGIANSDPQKTLHVTGEVRISDLDNGIATRIIGANADGDLDELTLGAGLSITSGTLSVTNPISASEVIIESSTATTIDLDANTGVVKNIDGANATFTYPTDLSRLSVYKNGVRLTRTGSVTTRDFSVNTGTNEITFTTALVSGDRIVIVKI